MNDVLVKIDQLRVIIDQLDEQIIDAIARRHYVSGKIGVLKEQNGLEIYNQQREEQLRSRYQKLSQIYNVDANLILEVFELIIKQSREIQKKG